ncbi:NAD-dependent epimerase/dehydratase family protein [Bacteroidota bacterium]
MRILIIGGTRFIGPPIVRSLFKNGHELTLFHRGKSFVELPNGIKHIKGDRQNLLNFLEQFKKLEPQLVLDMFPITEQDAQIVTNIFKGIVKRSVAISSQDVYRAYSKLIGIEDCQVIPVPLNEDAPLRKKIYPYRDNVKEDNKLYNYDKILVERIYMNEPELPCTVLRLPMVYGPGDYQHRLFPYLKRMDDNRSSILLEQGMAKWSSSRGYVENIANAVVITIENVEAVNRIYNISEEISQSEAEWIKAIAKAANWHGKIIVVPKEQAPEFMNPGIDTTQDLTVNTTKIQDELGYKELISQDEALRKTVEWERSHPPEKIDPTMFDYKAEDNLLERL